MIFLQWEVLYSAVCVSAFLHDFSREKLHPSLCRLPGIKEHSDTCLVCFCIYGEERRLHHSPLIRKVTSLSLESPAGVWREQPLRSFTLLMSTFVFINAPERETERERKEVYLSIHLILLDSLSWMCYSEQFKHLHKILSTSWKQTRSCDHLLRELIMNETWLCFNTLPQI